MAARAVRVELAILATLVLPSSGCHVVLSESLERRTPARDGGVPIDGGAIREDGGLGARDGGGRNDGGATRDDGGLGARDGDAAQAGELRLAGVDERPGRGRLEVFLDGAWGTVCDDRFDGNAALVACRQLGFAASAGTFDAVGGSGPIHMDDVTCDGGEARLVDCAFLPWGMGNCSHLEDVGLECAAGEP